MTINIQRDPPPANAFAYRINDACKMAGFGRTKLYQLANEGRLALIRVDGRTLVEGDSLRHLLAA